MKNKDLIRKFKEGSTKGIAGHLYIKENELIHYRTVIAYRDSENNFHLNNRHYTQSTTIIQNYCRDILNPIDEYYGTDFIKLDAGVKQYTSRIYREED